jgi:hypothetical protein
MTLFRSDYDGGDTGLFYMDTQTESNYYNKVIEAPFDNRDFNFGSTVICTMPKRDSIIKKITLKTVLGSLNPITSLGYVYTGNSSLLYTGTNEDESRSFTAFPYFGFYCTQYLGMWATGDIKVSVQNDRFVFDSDTIIFRTGEAATFWGFDNWYPGRVYTGVAPLTLIQSGWVPGFKPPVIYEKYNDNVGDLIVKRADLLIGGQTIQGMTTNTLTNQQLLYIPLENQAALTVLVGRGDTSYSNQPQTYWTELLVDQIPCSALRNQDIQIRWEVEQFKNLTSASLLGGFDTATAYTSLFNFDDSIISQLTVSPVIYGTDIFIAFNSSLYKFSTLSREAPVQVLSDIQIYSMRVGYAFIYVVTQESELGYFDTRDSTYHVLTSVPPVSTGIATYGSYVYYYTQETFYIWKQLYLETSPYTWTDYGIINEYGQYGLGEGTVIIFGKMFVPIHYSKKVLIIDVQTYEKLGLMDGNTYGLFYNISPGYNPNIADFNYIYYPANAIAPPGGIGPPTRAYIRLNINTYELEYFTAEILYAPEGTNDPIGFDGIYVYYRSPGYANEINTKLYRFDTTVPFNNKALTVMSFYKDWTAISSNGRKTQGVPGSNMDAFPYFSVFDGRYIYMIGSVNLGPDPTLSYLIYNTRCILFDPFNIVPSIKSTAIIDYSDLQNEPTSVPAALIEQDQVLKFVLGAGPDLKYILPFALKNLVWELRFETSAILNTLTLKINDILLFQEDALSLFVLRPFQNHIITPSVNIGIYKFKSPVNFSRIRYPSLELILAEPLQADTTLTMTAKTYNAITCSGGTGGLLFN